ncbi:MAG: flagellar biosynthesis anti-sigma factor FlgM [Lachnospiraceae bacterium]|nr:flagellar biosynthesis anti-sigma factor FlgM [Lachnospiraceae bacterium]
MNIRFQTVNSSYRTPVPAQSRKAPSTGKSRGNYDTVTIHGTQTSQETSFARVLARSAASQINEGASPEKVQDLKSRVSSGTYHPDADRIAGRLLGLN